MCLFFNLIVPTSQALHHFSTVEVQLSNGRWGITSLKTRHNDLIGKSLFYYTLINFLIIDYRYSYLSISRPSSSNPIISRCSGGSLLKATISTLPVYMWCLLGGHSPGVLPKPTVQHARHY